MARPLNFLRTIGDALLTSDYLRYFYVRLRYLLLARGMRILAGFEDDPNVVYNMDFRPAAFGCGGRMAMLLFPLRGFLFPHHNRARVLIVGPRTEDDIFWARSLGLREARGLDLFSYSPLIDLGDAHHTSYPDCFFDAVLLGWVLPYITHPQEVLSEMSRITVPGGVIGFGWHYVSDTSSYSNELADHALNSRSDIEHLIQGVAGEIFCFIDSKTSAQDHHKAVFFKVSKS